MEIKKFETYCNCNLTNLLIKAGFNWQDYFVAHSIDENFHWEIPLHIAQKWLRDVKGIHVYVISYRQNNQNKISGYCYKVYEFTQGWEFNCASYEEALEAGIKKACEIILNKK